MPSTSSPIDLWVKTNGGASMNSFLRQTISQLPGPKGLPILGNLFQIDLQKLHLILEEWSVIYGDLYKFRVLNETVVAVSDPALIQHILRDRPETYRRISTLERAARELGIPGVFTAEGEQWRRQRYLTMQAFKSDPLRRFFPNMQKITKRLYNRWNDGVDLSKAVDVRRDLMRFAVDATTHFAFGYDINLLEEKSDSFQRHLECQLAGINRRTSAPFPYWHFVKLPSDRAMEKSLVVIKKTIDEFVLEARQRLENEPGLTDQPSNFLEAMLLSKDDDDTGFSDEEIRGNIINILLAGEDSTAYTISWLVYFMTEYPEIQNKMQQEADSVLGEEMMPLDMSALEKLTYIEAVALETLRLKSAAPLLFLETNIDVELDGLTIPKATSIMLLIRSGALRDENFTDARHFKPQRWLELNSNAYTHNRNASLPFGAGPRFCPGRNLAMLKIKMAIAMVCKNFSVTRVETGRPVEEVFAFTMMPDNLKVKFEKR
jgi:cytochrome P450